MFIDELELRTCAESADWLSDDGAVFNVTEGRKQGDQISFCQISRDSSHEQLPLCSIQPATRGTASLVMNFNYSS